MTTDTELRLSLLLLENELAALKAENKQLKTTIEHMCMNECSNIKKKKTTSQATKDRWAYYHDHKHTVRTELGGSTISWRDVKRATDQRFTNDGASTSQIS